jgi:hypothetical protein
MQDFDVVGEEDMVLGAPLGMRGRGVAPGAMMARMAVRQPGWMHQIPQGISTPSEEMDYLPFDSFQLTDVITSGQLVAFPQRPFRGERLVASAVALIGGVLQDGKNFVQISPAIFVGAVQVGATQGAVPLSAFVPDAFGVRLSFPRAGQGTRIAIPISVVAGVPLAPGDLITVNITVIGRAVR